MIRSGLAKHFNVLTIDMTNDAPIAYQWNVVTSKPKVAKLGHFSQKETRR